MARSGDGAWIERGGGGRGEVECREREGKGGGEGREGRGHASAESMRTEHPARALGTQSFINLNGCLHGFQTNCEKAIDHKGVRLSRRWCWHSRFAHATRQQER